MDASGPHREGSDLIQIGSKVAVWPPERLGGLLSLHKTDILHRSQIMNYFGITVITDSLIKVLQNLVHHCRGFSLGSTVYANMES